jgi:hypothetical protein
VIAEAESAAKFSRSIRLMAERHGKHFIIATISAQLINSFNL